MNPPKSARIGHWVSLDQLRAAGRHTLQAGTIDGNEASLFLAHARDWDARKAEALLLTAPDAGDFLRVRIQLFRGRIADAQATLARIEREGVSDPEKAHLLLEKARLEAYRGEWSAAEALACAALACRPEPISVLTLHQVRALARFEAGDLSGASADLDITDSLRSIFPDATTAFYSLILRIKLEARARSLPMAREDLRRLWSAQAELGLLNIDRAHALVRAEIDLRRLAGERHEALALASLTLAETIGEQTYVGLALVDCLLGIPGLEPDQARELEQRLANGPEAELTKARRLLAEARGLVENPSTTARAISAMASSAQATGPRFSFKNLRSSNMEFLVVPSAGIVARIRPWQVTMPELLPQGRRALETLSRGPLSKELFFHELWGRQRYSARLHDTLIWTLLHRLRKGTGLKLRVHTGCVELVNAIVC